MFLNHSLISYFVQIMVDVAFYLLTKNKKILINDLLLRCIRFNGSYSSPSIDRLNNKILKGLRMCSPQRKLDSIVKQNQYSKSQLLKIIMIKIYSIWWVFECSRWDTLYIYYLLSFGNYYHQLMVFHIGHLII